jgi:UbiD family decarboxylase
VNPPTNLSQWIELLRKQDQITDIYHQVDPHLEIAEIHRRVVEKKGKALFFHNVKGSPFPVVTNLLGTPERVEIAFPASTQQFLPTLLELLHEASPSLKSLWGRRHALKRLLNARLKTVKHGTGVTQVKQDRVDLHKLPLLQLWPEDGGHFITLPLVLTAPVHGGPTNLGMYRIQRYDAETTGIHWQIAKGGGFHYAQAEELNRPLPVHIFVGGGPAQILSAILPLPENVPEILFSGVLQNKRVEISYLEGSSLPLLEEAEFALVGEVLPHERRLEGPFGDHYGYYSLEHPYPVFRCKSLFHRKNPIYPATVVGIPPQEDLYLGNYLQELLSPLFPVVMPGIKRLWTYGETGFHALAAAVIKERYHREAMATAFRILGEGQLSFTKVLLLTDREIDERNIKQVLVTILERLNPLTDLYILSNLCLDSLDYTGPVVNRGSRMVLLGVGEAQRQLPATYCSSGQQIPLDTAVVFCPGVLLVKLHQEDFFPITQELAAKLSQDPQLQQWPLIFIVDDPLSLSQDEHLFLWTVFMRFNPASDCYAATQVVAHHLTYAFPILIDARMKPHYPKVVEVDPATSGLVDQNWNHYFNLQ